MSRKREEGNGRTDEAAARASLRAQDDASLIPGVTTGGVGRREALKMLAVAPVLGAIGWTAVDIERAARAVAALGPSQAYVPKFFTQAEWRTVNVLVDYIIPADDRSGSATDARVPEFIDFMMSDELQNISQRSQDELRGGLAWLDAECGRRFSRTFVEASDAQRRQVLDDIAFPRRAREEMRDGVGFFRRIRDLTAAGFFSSRMGWEDLDYRGHTIVPEWNGCPEEAMQKLGVSHEIMNTRVPVQHGG